ncbi:hypothetical protein OM076_04815 [Solirubrobacter ginsenosidimutans]|uniref:Uncharacterized protein n=1 Tax=Solirubrobacter ginsenosidimutans TaxID=490573 RepID=A0A9X3MPR5_9ACTN|nr:hypothetical protein [Solirubrobacter ginsenosidimutans]MDA0159577.1 hypothetical protein [Solirubrobacter ginsenosidimutans]
MSGPREVIEALGRADAATISHLAQHGPTNALTISQACEISRPGARARLVKLHLGGVVALEDRYTRRFRGGVDDRFFLDPDALRYAARWLDALAARAERANRLGAIVPLAGGRSR